MSYLKNVFDSIYKSRAAAKFPDFSLLFKNPLKLTNSEMNQIIFSEMGKHISTPAELRKSI